MQIFGEEQSRPDTVTVSERGFVVLPKLGAVEVTAFTVGTVADTLRARYARYLRNPTVEVLMLRRIAVNGEVKNPNVYYLDNSAMLPDAIARAGGITETGNRRGVSIVRREGTIAVPDWDAANAPNTDLRSGDLIMVGRRSWLSQNFLSVISTTAAVASLLVILLK